MNTPVNKNVSTDITAAVKNSSFVAITKFYYLLIRSIYVIFFVKIIGVELYGLYNYAQNWYVLFMPLAMWGMDELLISEHVRTRPENRDDLIGSGLALRLVLGTACCLAIIVAALVMENVAELRLLIIIYSQGVIARGATSWLSSLFVARNKSHNWLYISVTFTTLEVLIILLLAYSGEPLLTIALAQSFIWWCTLAVTYAIYRSKFHGINLRWWSSNYLGFYFSKGASLGAATFALFCMTPGLLILYRYLAEDIQRMGEVALVLQVLHILNQIILVVSNAALPELNHITDSMQSGTATFSRLAWNYSFYVGGTIFLLCFSILPELISMLPATQFDDAVLLFANFSWIIIPLFALHCFRLVLISSANIRALLLIMITGLLGLVSFVFALDNMDRLNTFTVFVAMGSALSIIATLMLLFLCSLLPLLRVGDIIRAPLLLIACFALVLMAPGQASVLAGLVTAGILSAATVVEFRKSSRSSFLSRR